MSLEPIEPETALELFLKDKNAELAETTIKSHDYRLRHFVRWCNEQGIENLNTLTGRQLHEYRLWRREDGDLNKVSEKTQMDSLRSFIRWLEAVDGVEQDLSEKVLSPTITADENSKDVMLDSDRASAVLSHLEKYEYAGAQHVSLTLMWHTMMRVGGVQAIDVDDYNADEQYVKIRHRPDTGTPIKNKGDGERLIALSDDICDINSTQPDSMLQSQRLVTEGVIEDLSHQIGIVQFRESMYRVITSADCRSVETTIGKTSVLRLYVWNDHERRRHG
jgi:site-specific recombinase XerD